MSSLSERQARDIETVERSMSIVSLLGTFFIFWTFTRFPYFRKPINRLVMFASVGNCMANVATLIASSGIKAGAGSSLCQFQAFFIQMFLPADCLWTFCMALNVYLTFFKNYDAIGLRALEKWYIVFCYGLPFVPALIFLLLDATRNTGIYGNATLWCWISKEWDWMRIAFFYAPVWVVIVMTSTIYGVTGRDIFKQRAALRSFTKNQIVPLPKLKNPFTTEFPAQVTKVTEIKVTSEAVEEVEQSPSFDTDHSSDGESRMSYSSFHEAAQLRSHSRQGSHGKTYPPRKGSLKGVHCKGRNVNYITSVTSGKDSLRSDDVRMRGDSVVHIHSNNVAMRANTAAWGYAKVAMLMFIAMFIVWVPSTVNRLYSLIVPDKPIYLLNIFAAAVLPTQGWWNFAIYVSTSWSQCKLAWSEICADPVQIFYSRQRRLDETPNADRDISRRDTRSICGGPSFDELSTHLDSGYPGGAASQSHGADVEAQRS